MPCIGGNEAEAMVVQEPDSMDGMGQLHHTVSTTDKAEQPTAKLLFSTGDKFRISNAGRSKSEDARQPACQLRVPAR